MSRGRSLRKFTVGGFTFGAERSLQMLRHPRSHLFDRHTGEVAADRLRRGGFQQRAEGGEQTGEAALAVLAFQLLEQAKGRFQNLGAHRQTQQVV